MFALSLSPNMLSAASAGALFGLYQKTIEFVWTHSRARRQGAEEREVLIDEEEGGMCASMGTMTTIYVSFLVLIYFFPFLALLLYVIPAVLAYFYISVPMFFVYCRAF